MNAEWHRMNVMPKNATQEQRVRWHTDHQQFCGCRPVPATLRHLVPDVTGHIKTVEQTGDRVR